MRSAPCDASPRAVLTAGPTGPEGTAASWRLRPERALTSPAPLAAAPSSSQPATKKSKAVDKDATNASTSTAAANKGEKALVELKGSKFVCHQKPLVVNTSRSYMNGALRVSVFTAHRAPSSSALRLRSPGTQRWPTLSSSPSTSSPRATTPPSSTSGPRSTTASSQRLCTNRASRSCPGSVSP